MDARTTDLIADFHERHEAWRRQGQDLARLRADARAAASQEAAAILAVARADVSQIIVDARRALLVLTAQLQALTHSYDARAEGSPESDVPDSVEQARRDLQRVLDEVHPDLEELAAHVAQLVGPAAAAPAEPAPVETAAPDLALAEDRSSVSRPVLSELALRQALGERVEGPSRWRFVVASIVVATAVAGGGAWWLLGGGVGADDLAPPIASIPRVPAAPPSWLEEPLPTISASLVALPAAPAADHSLTSASQSISSRPRSQ